MMTITRHYQLEAAHFLPHAGVNHKCARVHGHNWRVSVVLGGEVDAERGWLVDFGKLDDIWSGSVHRELDHRLLNDVPLLDNPTSELVAYWIFFTLATRIESMPVAEWPRSVRVLSVTVAENGDSSATYGERQAQ